MDEKKLNDCYDELTEERKQIEIVLKELESKVAEYERKFEEGEVVSAEYHEEQMAILNCERNQLEKDVRDLQAEIERLKETYTCNTYKDSWKNKFFKAQEEVETQRKIIEYHDSLQDEVAMLKEERENMQAVIFALEEDKRMLQNFKDEAISMSLYGKGRKDGEEVAHKQAVKDTAKEILQDLFYFIDGNNFWLEETGNQVFLIKEKDALIYMRAQASKYEVEVEE